MISIEFPDFLISGARLTVVGETQNVQSARLRGVTIDPMASLIPSPPNGAVYKTVSRL